MIVINSKSLLYRNYAKNIALILHTTLQIFMFLEISQMFYSYNSILTIIY